MIGDLNDLEVFTQSGAAANPAIALRLQSNALVGRVAELGSLGGTTRMEIPEQFKDYDCRDYFDSDKFTRGYYDEHAQFWTFYAVADVREHPELEFLAVGSPGCDGLEWGYRKGHAGLWVFYPIEQRFELLAPTLAELFDGWYSERITV